MSLWVVPLKNLLASAKQLILLLLLTFVLSFWNPQVSMDRVTLEWTCHVGE